MILGKMVGVVLMTAETMMMAAVAVVLLISVVVSVHCRKLGSGSSGKPLGSLAFGFVSSLVILLIYLFSA